MHLSYKWGIAVSWILVLAGWYLGLFVSPTDSFQGDVYRIIYVHVPAAFAAFFTAFVLFIASLTALFRSRNAQARYWGIASAEVGLALTCLTLVTGMIWGKPTWGVFWTWDARLTTTFLLAIMYAGYMLLYTSIGDLSTRAKASAILGILIFADVPVIYKSVQWWRTLHQPQTLIRPDGAPSTMDPTMRGILLFCIFGMLVLAVELIRLRARLHREKELQEEALLS